MSYKGRQLSSGNYLKLDDLSSQFNGIQKTFNLTTGGQAFYPGSAFSIIVVLGGVIQEPESAYTIDQSQIIFAAAPGPLDDFFCITLGIALSIGVPADGTVTYSKLAPSARGIGIQSGGVTVGVGVSQLNFIGAGNTFYYNSATNTVNITGVGTDTLNSITSRGNSTSNDISVGVITATSLVKSGGTSSQFLKADGSVDSSTYLTTTGSGINLTGIVTSIVAGTNITVSNSTGRVTIDASGGGGSSDLVGLSTLGFFSDNQNITSSTTLPANTLLYTVHKNINVATGSTITIGSGSTVIMDRLNNLDNVVAISFKGDGSQLTGIPVGDLYELDQISPAGRENTYTPTFNYDTVTVTDPFKLLISVNGVIQSAYVHNTEYVFNNSLLASRTGYTIDYDNKIKFTEALPEGSEVMIKTISGTTKSTTRKYPFNALDVLF